jgi:hypothetical protein
MSIKSKLEKEIINLFSSNNFNELTVSQIFDNVKDKLSFDDTDINDFTELIISICDKLVSNNILENRLDDINKLSYYSFSISNFKKYKIDDNDINLENYDIDSINKLINEYKNKNDYDNLELLYQLKYYQFKKNKDIQDLKIFLTDLQNKIENKLIKTTSTNIDIEFKKIHQRVNELRYSLVTTNLFWFFLFMFMWFFN